MGKKIRVAVVGYGNIGRYVIEAVEATNDMEIVGVVRRNATQVPAELTGYSVVDAIEKLGDVDVALLTVPTRNVEQMAVQMLAKGINTVDSFDIHGEIVTLRRALDKAAKESGAVAIVSAGWDPGSDSIVRALLEICAPKGVTYTNFGPGMSMGHTVAVKAISGVKAALSMTIPTGMGVHSRMVFVELEEGADFVTVEAAVKSDPYFVHDETVVRRVDDIDTLIDMGHGVKIERKGGSGVTSNQRFEFGMSINNPALTAQVMVASARASMRQASGAYTLIEIPVIDFIVGDSEDIITRLV